tara:strand:+ start:388 stop:537 length:150 start_codon:yes stop_codon:yes gene_type:complete
MITTELRTIFIASDGKKFFSRSKAEDHERQIQQDSDNIQRLLDTFEDYY